MDKSVRPLVLTWLALLALLATTAGCALLRLGWLNTDISLANALDTALERACLSLRNGLAVHSVTCTSWALAAPS